MAGFSVGNLVLVSDNIASEYARQLGNVVGVETRQADALQVAEYEVEFNDGRRRCFLEFQLSLVPEKRSA
jgi:hypothetical protein